MLLQIVTPHAINAAVYSNLNFDFIRDIAPVIWPAVIERGWPKYTTKTASVDGGKRLIREVSNRAAVEDICRAGEPESS